MDWIWNATLAAPMSGVRSFWQCPLTGWVKVNVDGVVDTRDRSVLGLHHIEIETDNLEASKILLGMSTASANLALIIMIHRLLQDD
ncbi:hypothetical protein V6N11_058941 [Hibiscus sabdariffa]|uniref:RNase H type-1 domain-containing protein n=1 Tax=Hibiscus sabdariffa TaxID=183260 RepID=A0ABR2U6B0_9ROSI